MIVLIVRVGHRGIRRNGQQLGDSKSSFPLWTLLGLLVFFVLYAPLIVHANLRLVCGGFLTGAEEITKKYGNIFNQVWPFCLAARVVLEVLVNFVSDAKLRRVWNLSDHKSTEFRNLRTVLMHHKLEFFNMENTAMRARAQSLCRAQLIRDKRTAVIAKMSRYESSDLIMTAASTPTKAPKMLDFL